MSLREGLAGIVEYFRQVLAGWGRIAIGASWGAAESAFCGDDHPDGSHTGFARPARCRSARRNQHPVSSTASASGATCRYPAMPRTVAPARVSRASGDPVVKNASCTPISRIMPAQANPGSAGSGTSLARSAHRRAIGPGSENGR